MNYSLPQITMLTAFTILHSLYQASSMHWIIFNQWITWYWTLFRRRVRERPDRETLQEGPSFQTIQNLDLCNEFCLSFLSGFLIVVFYQQTHFTKQNEQSLDCYCSCSVTRNTQFITKGLSKVKIILLRNVRFAFFILRSNLSAIHFTTKFKINDYAIQWSLLS